MLTHVLNAVARRLERAATSTPNPDGAECVAQARKAERENRWREAAGWWFAGITFAQSQAVREVCAHKYEKAKARAACGGGA